MKRKVTTMLLILITIALISPMAAQALPNLIVNKAVAYYRHGFCDYTFRYQLRNNGPDDLVNATFYDAAGFYEGGRWRTEPDSIVNHTNYDLGAGDNSEWFYWRSDTPAGFVWWCQCTDEGDDIPEENENDNCLVKLGYFW